MNSLPAAALSSRGMATALPAAAPGLSAPSHGLALRKVGNAMNEAWGSLGTMACVGLDALAPGRLLRCSGRLFTAAMAVASIGNVGGRPQRADCTSDGPDAVDLYANGVQQAVESCISRLSATSRPAERVVAHCLGASAGAVCDREQDPQCGTVLYRSVEDAVNRQALTTAAQDTPPDYQVAIRHLKTRFRNSDCYIEAMAVLERAVSARLVGDIAAPDVVYTAAALRTLLAGDMSVEDPLQIVGVEGKKLYSGLLKEAGDMYQLDPELMDKAVRERFMTWLDRQFPDLPRLNARNLDLSDAQIDRILHELAGYLNHKYPVV